MNYVGYNVLVYNENWEYQRTINPPSNEYPSTGPTYSISINGSIYVTAENVTNKYDKYLNLTKQINSPGLQVYPTIGLQIVGISYNSANQMIYIAKYYSIDSQ